MSCVPRFLPERETRPDFFHSSAPIAVSFRIWLASVGCETNVGYLYILRHRSKFGGMVRIETKQNKAPNKTMVRQQMITM